MKRIEPNALRSFIREALERKNVPADNAATVADVLVTANLLGIDSHGVVRLPHYIRRLENGTLNALPEISFEQTSPTTGVIDGDDALGHVAMAKACDHLIALAKESGTASITVKNSSHFGITGYYVRKILESDLIGFAMTPSDALLIPFGASKPFFGTNPLAIGFPAPLLRGQTLPPVVLDMSTTSIPYGKIVLAQKEGRDIPDTWGFDESGKPTTDANSIVGMHPIAGAKGSGIAMIIDIFCSVLGGMAFGPHINKMYKELDEPRKLGHFLSAWDPARFRPLSDFREDLGRMVDEMHALPKADGFDRIYYPGELEAERRRERERNGIPIEPGVLQELSELAAELELELELEGLILD